MALKIPGMPAAGGGGVVSPRSPIGQPQATLPDIYEADPEDARPSIALIGGSGTGKTTQIRNLIRAGFNVLVVATESKQQALASERPMIMPIGAPVREGATVRPATPTDKYNRLMLFRDQLKEGKYRVHNGRPIDIIAYDGAMELGAIIKAHRMKNVAVSKTGETNTFKTFDEIGIDLIDFFASCREASSDASKAFGIPPLGIVMTCGETLKDGQYKPILPGHQANDMLPYQFEMILRMAVELVDGDIQYVAHTVPGETQYPVEGRWTAKSPGGLFPPKIINPDLGAIYKSLVSNYKGETPLKENNG